MIKNHSGRRIRGEAATNVIANDDVHWGLPCSTVKDPDPGLIILIDDGVIRNRRIIHPIKGYAMVHPSCDDNIVSYGDIVPNSVKYRNTLKLVVTNSGWYDGNCRVNARRCHDQISIDDHIRSRVLVHLSPALHPIMMSSIMPLTIMVCY